MKCPTCGNQDLREHRRDLVCSFCRTIVANPIQEILIEEENRTKSYKKFEGWEKISHSVMTIKHQDQVGTGFLISDTGLVITNYHVVKDAEVVYGQFDEEEISYPLYPIKLGNEDLDLCVLQLDSNNHFVGLEWATELTNLGDEVVTIGNPRGIGLSISKGVVSRLDDDGNLQLNMQLNPGNSGGPVFNQQGKLIGIISFMIQELSGMSFAIGINEILRFVEEYSEDL